MVETLPARPIDLAELGARATNFARTSRSAATDRAYRSDWADFSSWCERAGLPALPADPTTVGASLSAHVEALKVATLNRRIAAITAARVGARFLPAIGQVTLVTHGPDAEVLCLRPLARAPAGGLPRLPRARPSPGRGRPRGLGAHRGAAQAPRVEQLTKEYSARLIVSDSMMAALGAAAEGARPLGAVAVNCAEPVPIWGLD
jgi:hypothetical protein